MQPRAIGRFAWFVIVAQLAAVPLSSAATAGETALPAWSALVFEGSRFGVTARTEIEVASHPDREAAWSMHASSSVGSNSEEVNLVLKPASGAVLERRRLSKGKKSQRYKTYDYQADHILRIRHEPGGDAGSDPSTWPESSRVEVAYPDGADKMVVTEAYVLLLLAARQQPAPAAVLVHTDFNFYQVSFDIAEGPEVEVDYAVAGTDERVVGGRATRVVSLQVTPFGKQPDDRDFSLFGFEEDIEISFDAETGVPVQLRGIAPRIGRTTIGLLEMSRREN